MAPEPEKEPPAADEPAPAPLLQLHEPLTPIIDERQALDDVVSRVAAGAGPVALDAERASGYRYSSRAYLIQLRRDGVGTALIDPIPFGDLTDLDAAIGDSEWLLHAASQDLPCLVELGMVPRRLFDTELAGRLLNLPRVGLASLVEEFLGHSLAKEHSAVDWSTRPLPGPWLEYAALDVEALIELRDILGTQLAEAGKLAWAEEEFDALTRFTGPPARTDPWRRTSGIHRARGRRALAIVRTLWEARDTLAEAKDTTPGRLLHDSALVQLAQSPPTDRAGWRRHPALRHRQARAHLDDWEAAVAAAQALPDRELPLVSPHTDAPPPPRTWPDKDPAAAARLRACREAVTAIAAANELPTENLITPDFVRRLAWTPPAPLDLAAVEDALTAKGARPWQIGLTAQALLDGLRATAPRASIEA